MRKTWMIACSFLCQLGCEKTPDFDEIGALEASMLPASPTNDYADDPLAARLGQALFFDEGLSADGEVSCASCHDPEHGFSDRRAVSEGAFERTGRRHAPTLVNIAFAERLMWDGRFDSLWAQPIRAIEDENEGDFTRLEVAHYLNARYADSYEAVFGPLPDLSELPARGKPGDGVWSSLPAARQRAINRVAANLGKAIEAYERQLLCVDTEFDRFVRGEGEISVAAFEGARAFLDDDEGACTRCHSGPNLTDNRFHNLLISDGGAEPDPGQVGADVVWGDEFNGAGEFSDDRTVGAARLAVIEAVDVELGAFKTPTLRGVTQRAPYGHLGASRDLDEWFDDVYDDNSGGGRGRGRRGRGNDNGALGVRSPLAPDFDARGNTMEAFLRTFECPPLPTALVTPLEPSEVLR